ncbi:hypothetical protein EBR57_10865, partial [bacterium]|nr:hypothetical protein [bacterium]
MIDDMNRYALPYRQNGILRCTKMTSEIDMTRSESLPLKPNGVQWLEKVEFSQSICKNNDVRLELARFNNIIQLDAVLSKIDVCGMAEDSWWILKCANLPNRILRLTKGTKSMTQLLVRYGFMDRSGCVNHRHVLLTYSNDNVLPTFNVASIVPSELRDATGIPQFFANSGVCWFNTMCCTSFANPRLRNYIIKYMEEHNQTEMARLATTCLFNREDAQKFRNLLWEQYKLGDNIYDKPENDGRNGCTEFTLLCAKLKIPIIRYKEEKGQMMPMKSRTKDYYNVLWELEIPTSLQDEFILVLRFHESNHDKYRIYPRIKYLEHKFDLCGMYLGQSKCGHQ